MGRQFYVQRGQAVTGPVDSESLKQGVRNGKIIASDQLGRSPDGPWTRAEFIPMLARLFAPKTSPVPEQDDWETAFDESATNGESLPDVAGQHRPSVSAPTPTEDAGGGFRWLILGGGLVTVILAVGVGVFLWSWTAESPTPAPPDSEAAATLFDSLDHFERAATAFGDTIRWIDGAEVAAAAGDVAAMDTALAATQAAFPGGSEIGGECRRLVAILKKYKYHRKILDEAIRKFCHADPNMVFYDEFDGPVQSCRQSPVVRLRSRADTFGKVLAVARDDAAAVARLAPLSEPGFNTASTVPPLSTDTSSAGLMFLAEFHANVRNTRAATTQRRQLRSTRKAGILADNRQNTRDAPLVLRTPRSVAEAVRDIATRHGSSVILSWTSKHAVHFVLPGDAAAAGATLQKSGWPLWPIAENSLAVQLSPRLLGQLTTWLEGEEQAVVKARALRSGELAVYGAPSPGMMKRFVIRGQWARDPVLVLAGELVEDTLVTGHRAVLRADTVVVGLAPTLATLAYNREHLGLSGRVFRDKQTFRVTVHRPAVSKEFHRVGGKGFDPYKSADRDGNGDGEPEYLLALCRADKPTLTSASTAITVALKATVRKIEALDKAAQAALESRLVTAVGAKRARIDARLIGGAGRRALINAANLAHGSRRVRRECACYVFNTQRLNSSMSNNAKKFFKDNFLDTFGVCAVARDGVWLLTNAEMCQIADRVVAMAGFGSDGGRVVSEIDRLNRELNVLTPLFPPEPIDPLAPPRLPTLAVPTHPQLKAAHDRFVEAHAASSGEAAKSHRNRIESGEYSSDLTWLEYRRQVAEWEASKRRIQVAWDSRRSQWVRRLSTYKGSLGRRPKLVAVANDTAETTGGRLDADDIADGKSDQNDVHLLPSIDVILRSR